MAEHQIVIESGKRIQLFDVEGVGLQHVGHHAKLFLANVKILLGGFG